MKIYLTKEHEQRTIKAGPALYLLCEFIPFFGGIIKLIIAIVNKQFKGAILNPIIAVLIPSFVCLFLEDTLELLGLVILLIAYITLYIYILVISITNTNKYSLQQYLEDGYTIENEESLPKDVQAWIQENKDKKKPFFYLLKF